MASGPSTFALTVAGGLVRQLWPAENLIEEVIEEDPVLGMCTKETDWGNDIRHHPLGWGANQGVGRTAADAKRLKSTPQSAEFQVGTREMFSFLSLEGKLLRTFEYTSKKALLVDPLKRAGDGAIDRMRRRFSASIHGNGVGVIGALTTTSNVTTTTVTLRDFNDLKHFEEDVAFQIGTTGVTGDTLIDGNAEARISGIGTEDNPTLTLSVPWNVAFPSINAAGAFIYATGTLDNDYIYGLDAYLPLHTGTPGTFLTCNRNRNPGWLAGRCITGTNLTVYQRIKKAARRIVDAGRKPDTYLLSTRNFEKLEFEFDNKLQLTKFPAADVGKYKMGVTYTGVEVQGPRGPIKVLPSMWMPDTVERCGEMDSLVMGSIGPLVHWDDGNGPTDLRTEDGTDARELRAVSDPAFLVKVPGAWVRVAV